MEALGRIWFRAELVVVKGRFVSYNLFMAQAKKAVILLPVFNERDNIERFIKEIFAVEKDAGGWRFEILIVNDERSNDGTWEVVQELTRHNPRIHAITVGPGLGTALIKGHQYSIKHFHPQALAQLDADGQVGADVLPRLLAVLDEGYDLAIGSRFVKGGRNMLSPSRKFFTWGSSIFSRLVMGPLDIGEWSNSARAFTPSLFNKLNFDLIPWQEKTFIIQPSFLNAAVVAGARYKEVPLIFKDRAEGYSKMKIFNYSYDVIAYSIDARLRKLGFNLPIFRWSRKTKTFIKFGVVGVLGTIVDFSLYKLLINGFGFPPATAKGFSTEGGIINNFFFNNFWTFRHRKVRTTVWQRFLMYNAVSFGGLAIAVLVVKFLHTTYGDGFITVWGRPVAYNNFYFFATIPPVMAWNFTVNHFVTWRHRES